MTFHDKAAATDSLQTIYQPVHGTEFDRLLSIVDASLDEVRKQEAIPIPAKRGIVRWWFR